MLTISVCIGNLGKYEKRIGLLKILDGVIFPINMSPSKWLGHSVSDSVTDLIQVPQQSPNGWSCHLADDQPPTNGPCRNTTMQWANTFIFFVLKALLSSTSLNFHLVCHIAMRVLVQKSSVAKNSTIWSKRFFEKYLHFYHYIEKIRFISHYCEFVVHVSIINGNKKLLLR